jgi:hypothetical protein
MKDLIRKLLKEENFNEVWGCDLFTNPNDKEFCSASSTKLQDRKYKNIIFAILEKLKEDLKSEAYSDLRNKIKTYTKEDKFFKKNIEQVQTLIDKVGSSCPDSVENIKKKANNESNKTLFVYEEKVEDEIEHKYSLLNKLNTNYTALAYILTKFREKQSHEYKSTEGFDTIYNDFFVKKREKIGETEFYNLILNYFRKKLEKTEFETIQAVHNTIKQTTTIGQKTEKDFEELLKIANANYIIFSGDFSWVDMMGVDLIWEANGKWFPVQIKTNQNTCYGNKIFCKNFCVGKNLGDYRNWDGTWVVKEYDGESFVKEKKLPLE